MKKLLCVLFVTIFFILNSNAQSIDSLSLKSYKYKSDMTIRLDSVAQQTISDIYEKLYDLNQLVTPRYKLYKTENIHILLKLDTATGRVWMVQYSIGDTDAVTVAIDATSLLYDWEEYRSGRYELYPTQNMYNFILLDTRLGETYQVQWHTNEEKRMRVRIY